MTPTATLTPLPVDGARVVWHDAGRVDDRARRQAQRLAAERRQRQLQRELAAAIAAGDAACRRLQDRLDDFGARLAVLRPRLSTAPARATRS